MAHGQAAVAALLRALMAVVERRAPKQVR